MDELVVPTMLRALSAVNKEVRSEEETLLVVCFAYAKVSTPVFELVFFHSAPAIPLSF